MSSTSNVSTSNERSRTILVLTRCCERHAQQLGHDTIVIGSGESQISIVLMETRKGQKARLGITAPLHVPVHRLEIRRAIDEQEGAVLNNAAIVNLKLALEDALFYHKQLAPTKPTTPDLAPMTAFHLWEDREATLRHLLLDIEERGERIYAD